MLRGYLSGGNATTSVFTTTRIFPSTA